MFTSNPYAQGGWYNPQNPLSINGSAHPHPWFPNASLPPTFGALPTVTYPTNTLSFEFSPAQPDILICFVVGPNRTTYFKVVTPNGATLILMPRDDGMVRIEWQAEPKFEIRNVIPNVYALQWVRLSQDQSYRTMSVGGRNVWAPCGGAIIVRWVG
ncbi:hypothetical protein FA15DRAFT_600322 [Coprinopsis marcescibilis]|uniref:Uncharacterized protein n=1 Tax=Coprinopsis marcescibilis TaxID=230819 RepID=A0A5C3KJS3_COPMA|nr:hypothetical protein FA15DRAFT_600322 [Coprinopsis marcescibilis]